MCRRCCSRRGEARAGTVSRFYTKTDPAKKYMPVCLKCSIERVVLTLIGYKLKGLYRGWD